MRIWLKSIWRRQNQNTCKIEYFVISIVHTIFNRGSEKWEDNEEVRKFFVTKGDGIHSKITHHTEDKAISHKTYPFVGTTGIGGSFSSASPPASDPKLSPLISLKFGHVFYVYTFDCSRLVEDPHCIQTTQNHTYWLEFVQLNRESFNQEPAYITKRAFKLTYLV